MIGLCSMDKIVIRILNANNITLHSQSAQFSVLITFYVCQCVCSSLVHLQGKESQTEDVSNLIMRN